MQITTRTDYSLRMLIYLYTHQGEPVGVQQVADAYGISVNHLAKVAQTLVRAGWVESVRGRNGGFTITPAALEVSIGEIFRYTETNMELVACFGSEESCVIEPVCGLKHLLEQAKQAFLKELDQKRLPDIASKRAKLAKLIPLI